MEIVMGIGFGYWLWVSPLGIAVVYRRWVSPLGIAVGYSRRCPKLVQSWGAGGYLDVSTLCDDDF